MLCQNGYNETEYSNFYEKTSRKISTKIMIKAKCEDWDNWKKVYDDFAHIREGFSKDIFIGHEAENPNNLVLIQEIPSMEEMHAFMAKPENAEAISKSGVKLDTMKVTNLAD